MKILGIKNPPAWPRLRLRRRFRCWLPSAAKCGASGLAGTGGAGRTDPGLYHFRSEHGLGPRHVYQADLAFVRSGQDVSVETDAYPQAFHGRISYVAPALDPSTRTLQARIVVDNPEKS